MQRLEFQAMGCHMLAVADVDGSEATEQLALVPQWFADWEHALSRFMPDSELNQLNQRHSTPFHSSETLLEVLAESLAAAEASDGLVTPAVLDAVHAAGYNRSFAELDERDQAVQLASVPDWRSIRLEETQHTIQLPEGMHLDFGGIAKGWAADRVVRRLGMLGPILMDAGGDVAVSGPMANGDPWAIGIADPFNPGDNLALVLLDHGGVATSGRDYRRWIRNGKWQHHIIDPRTGQPAETDILSATVIAPTTAQAEVAAKVVLILGSEAGLGWVEEHPELAALALLEDGRHLSSSQMDRFLWHEPATFVLAT